MRLDPPLSNLFARCMTICVAECCGIDAYDLHPIHVASFLLMYRGAPEPREVEQLRDQLTQLATNYGSMGVMARGVSLEDLNQSFTGPELDEFVEKVRSALDRALSLIAQTTS